MRLEALLLAAGIAVASASPAYATPTAPCEPKGWLAEIICKAKQAQEKQAEARPRSFWSWLRSAAWVTEPTPDQNAQSQPASAPRSPSG